MNAPVITVDGPSGTGKGTLSIYLARWLHWHLLDSGALYRVLAVARDQQRVPVSDIAALCKVAETMDVRFMHTLEDDLCVLLAGEDITTKVRMEEIGNSASRIAAIPEIRQALLDRQHAFRQPPGLVADGRDMGTVVFTDAELKIFLTASPGVRAQRRHKQLNEKGFDVNLAQLSVEITERDARDSQRAVSPLRPADDAVIIDTTQLTIADVKQQVSMLVKDRFPHST